MKQGIVVKNNFSPRWTHLDFAIIHNPPSVHAGMSDLDFARTVGQPGNSHFEEHQEHGFPDPQRVQCFEAAAGRMPRAPAH